MPLDQAVLEHQSLGIVADPRRPAHAGRAGGSPARHDRALLEAASEGRPASRGIDLSAFAMIRALHRPGDADATLYLSVGGITNFAVAVGTDLRVHARRRPRHRVDGRRARRASRIDARACPRLAEPCRDS